MRTPNFSNPVLMRDQTGNGVFAAYWQRELSKLFDEASSADELATVQAIALSSRSGGSQQSAIAEVDAAAISGVLMPTAALERRIQALEELVLEMLRLPTDTSVIKKSVNANNSIITVQRLVRMAASAGAAGIGAAVDTELENDAAANITAASVRISLDVATSGAETSRFDVLLRNVGAALASAFTATSGFIFALGTIFFKAGTSFLGQFTHSNTGNRTYTMPDSDGTIVFTGTTLTANDAAFGDGTSKVKTVNAATARSNIGAAASGATSAHSITLAALTGGGSTGSIDWNADGCITGFSDPT